MQAAQDRAVLAVFGRLFCHLVPAERQPLEGGACGAGRGVAVAPMAVVVLGEKAGLCVVSHATTGRHAATGRRRGDRSEALAAAGQTADAGSERAEPCLSGGLLAGCGCPRRESGNPAQLGPGEDSAPAGRGIFGRFAGVGTMTATDGAGAVTLAAAPRRQRLSGRLFAMRSRPRARGSGGNGRPLMAAASLRESLSISEDWQARRSGAGRGRGLVPYREGGLGPRLPGVSSPLVPGLVPASIRGPFGVGPAQRTRVPVGILVPAHSGTKPRACTSGASYCPLCTLSR